MRGCVVSREPLPEAAKQLAKDKPNSRGHATPYTWLGGGFFAVSALG